MPTKPYESDELQARIDAGIREHRMSDATVRVTGANGQPLADVEVKVEQTASDFLFGANLFMLGGYGSAAENARYEEAFVRLFNAATVPLYWKDLEPEPGRPRFGADSEPIHRRPPPDAVVEFCAAHGLNMNGHCLVWDHARHSIPEWFVGLADKKAAIERRIRRIGERYGQRIQRWDVLNEAVLHYTEPERRPDYPLPDGYEAWAFECAARHLPATAHCMINETMYRSWVPEQSGHYRALIDELLAGGARIDGIGFQWHMFTAERQQEVLAGEFVPPREMLDTLDAFVPYRRPLHISEITIHAFDNDAPGQAIQAELARDVYRLWFSHPAVHAITWWNVPDGGAVAGEDKIFSGLLNKDLSTKPAFDALAQLIHGDWRTETAVRTGGDGAAGFRGFHGDYTLSVDGARRPFGLHAGAENTCTIDTENA